ncbi:hypothetical protein Tco_1006062 [Tanacetum coccineum]|uniref:Uncharacterized protein n=1 Tax=Tanacetum coccineum TaxID=301880 RepID=A0ABQ5FHK2_9ASTR
MISSQLPSRNLTLGPEIKHGLNVLGIERGILSRKGSGGGRGVKEKNLNKEKSLNRNSMNTSSVSESFPPLTTPVTLRRYCPVRSSYANITGKPIGEEVECCTFDTPGKVLSAIATKLGTPLMLDSYTSDMCMQSWGRSSYARVMIELRADVELKDNIVMAILKLLRRAIYTCNVRDEYEWKLLGAGEKKTMKKPSQTFRGVSVGPKWVLNLKKNIDMLLDNDKNPLVPTGIAESDSEVKVVFDETANLRILTSGKDRSDKGYGTNSLLEQWRDSYPDNDDYDPYDDDMYENHDLSEHLQSICDDLDITLRTGDAIRINPDAVSRGGKMPREVEVVYDWSNDLLPSS